MEDKDEKIIGECEAKENYAEPLEPKPKKISTVSGWLGSFKQSKLEEMLRSRINYTVDLVIHTKNEECPDENTRKVWSDYCLIWNCLRDPTHADCMGNDIKKILITYYPSKAHHRTDRKLYIEAFKKVVLELEDKIKSYWDHKNP